MRLFTGGEYFGGSATFPAGSSAVEPGVSPASAVTLKWQTFTDAADQAGISRRFGGIHFKKADLVGRAAGELVALRTWDKAKSLWSGSERRGGDEQESHRYAEHLALPARDWALAR